MGTSCLMASDQNVNSNLQSSQQRKDAQKYERYLQCDPEILKELQNQIDERVNTKFSTDTKYNPIFKNFITGHCPKPDAVKAAHYMEMFRSNRDDLSHLYKAGAYGESKAFYELGQIYAGKNDIVNAYKWYIWFIQHSAVHKNTHITESLNAFRFLNNPENQTRLKGICAPKSKGQLKKYNATMKNSIKYTSALLQDHLTYRNKFNIYEPYLTVREQETKDFILSYGHFKYQDILSLYQVYMKQNGQGAFPKGINDYVKTPAGLQFSLEHTQQTLDFEDNILDMNTLIKCAYHLVADYIKVSNSEQYNQKIIQLLNLALNIETDPLKKGQIFLKLGTLHFQKDDLERAWNYMLCAKDALLSLGESLKENNVATENLSGAYGNLATLSVQSLFSYEEGSRKDAEQYFRNAVTYYPSKDNIIRFGDFLKQQPGRKDDAKSAYSLLLMHHNGAQLAKEYIDDIDKNVDLDNAPSLEDKIKNLDMIIQQHFYNDNSKKQLLKDSSAYNRVFDGFLFTLPELKENAHRYKKEIKRFTPYYNEMKSHFMKNALSIDLARIAFHEKDYTLALAHINMYLNQGFADLWNVKGQIQDALNIQNKITDHQKENQNKSDTLSQKIDATEDIQSLNDNENIFFEINPDLNLTHDEIIQPPSSSRRQEKKEHANKIKEKRQETKQEKLNRLNEKLKLKHEAILKSMNQGGHESQPTSKKDMVLCVHKNAHNKFNSWKDDAKVKEFLTVLRNGKIPHTGQPETLKHGYMGHKNCISLRVTQKDRLIFTLEDNTVRILDIGGHYDAR